ncbi:MAG: hypothetical protein IJ206_06275 [Oscillospiraceae bacterium]|nr:hypothetical protein [Oscillospiraceae bacterium]
MLNFPQICFFAGHTHYTLRSTKTTTEIDGVDYFNTAAVAYLWEGDGEGDHLTGSEGYYVDLYPDHVEVRGRDFMRGSWISEACFSVSVPTELPALPGSVTIQTDPADRTLTADLTGLPKDAHIAWLKDGIPVLNAFSRQLTYAQSDGCSEFSVCIRT